MKIVVLGVLNSAIKRDIANHAGVKASDIGYGIEAITDTTEIVVIVSDGANVPMVHAKAAFTGKKVVYQYTPHPEGPRGNSCPATQFNEVAPSSNGYFRRVTNYYELSVDGVPTAVLY